MNLFLALLLSSFGASNLSAPTSDGEPNKLAEAFDRIDRFKAWTKRLSLNCMKAVRAKLTNQISDQTPGNYFKFLQVYIWICKKWNIRSSVTHHWFIMKEWKTISTYNTVGQTEALMIHEFEITFWDLFNRMSTILLMKHHKLCEGDICYVV